MNENKMAEIICELRKSKNMTQKELAQKLNITDKAVSKWERGLGYPDITILSRLAEVLGVTANDLLDGQCGTEDAEVQKPEAIVNNALRYVGEWSEAKRVNFKTMVKFIISMTFLLGVFTSVICDLAITRSFSWSIYVISSCVLTWLLVMPLFQFKRHKWAISLAALSVLVIPFLYVILRTAGYGEFFATIAVPISIIVLVALWIICFLIVYTKIRAWYVAALGVILVMPIQITSNAALAKTTGLPIFDMWDLMSCVVAVFIAIVFFLLGSRFKKRG